MKLPIDDAALAQVCQQFHIQRLAFFGSVLRSDFHSASDVDVLVEFAPEAQPDFIQLYDLDMQLSYLFAGRSIDLVTFAALDPLVRDNILNQAVIYYEQR